MKKNLIISLFIFLGLFSMCSKKMSIEDVKKANPLLDRTFEMTAEYVKELELWKENRYKSITSPTGWLSLVGLHWLKEGENTIGKAEDNDITFDEMRTKYAGSFVLNEGKIKLKTKNESFVNSKMKADSDGTVKHDGEGKPTVLNMDSYYMHVIKRGDRYGLRVKNTISDKRFSLPEIPTYPLSSEFVKYAQFVPTSESTKMNVETVIGVDTEYEVAGHLKFLHGGEVKQLLVFDGSASYFFLIFKDLTSGDQTYGGGRFIDVPKTMDANNILLLDFNKSYNAPCAFSDFATCPIPPIENHLDFSVEAGEKIPVFNKK